MLIIIVNYFISKYSLMDCKNQCHTMMHPFHPDCTHRAVRVADISGILEHSGHLPPDGYPTHQMVCGQS